MRSHTPPFGSHYTHVRAHTQNTLTPSHMHTHTHTHRGADADLCNLKHVVPFLIYLCIAKFGIGCYSIG